MASRAVAETGAPRTEAPGRSHEPRRDRISALQPERAGCLNLRTSVLPASVWGRLLLIEEVGPDFLFDHLMSDVVGRHRGDGDRPAALGSVRQVRLAATYGLAGAAVAQDAGTGEVEPTARRCTLAGGRSSRRLGDSVAGPDDRLGVHVGGDVLGRWPRGATALRTSH